MKGGKGLEVGSTWHPESLGLFRPFTLLQLQFKGPLGTSAWSSLGDSLQELAWR